jgi:hypothetical protein
MAFPAQFMPLVALLPATPPSSAQCTHPQLLAIPLLPPLPLPISRFRACPRAFKNDMERIREIDRKLASLREMDVHVGVNEIGLI